MNAWLITWRYADSHGAREEIVAVIGSRKSERTVADFVEQLYLLTTSSGVDVTTYANIPSRRPRKAKTTQVINRVPHGERIVCGANPFIYARKVSNLKVDRNSADDTEIFSWEEPATFKWKDDRMMEIMIDRRGDSHKLVRHEGPLLRICGLFI